MIEGAVVTFDYNAAEKAVLEVLAKAENELKVRLFVSDVIEFEFGWLFLYEGTEYVATMGANASLVFDKTDGMVYVPGFAEDIESGIEQYRRGIRSRA